MGKTALDLAEAAGIQVPKSRLLRIKGRSVLLTERFDRKGKVRIPYLSGMTAVQGRDGGRYSYLDLVAFLEEFGISPERDIRELWRRVLFCCAIGNVDDHKRNHGFLRVHGGWRLSPAFDINPTPGDNPKYLHTAVDFDNGEAHPQVVVDACECYRISSAEARTEVRAMSSVIRHWRKVATANGIAKTSQDYMASCMDAGLERLASAS